MLRHWSEVVVACALAFCCLPAMAQIDESGSVSGTGQVTLRPKATMLRFQVTLSERGDDMERVEKSLEAKCAAFRKALLAAKATPGSIHVDVIKISGGLRAVGLPFQGQYPWGKGKWQYQKPVQMPPKRMQAPSTTPPIQGPPSPAQPERREPRITLQTQVTSDWPLHGSTAAELLVEADAIVRRVYEQMLPIIPKKKAGNPRPASDNEADETFAANPHANELPAPNPAPNQGMNNQAGEPSDVDNYTPTYVFIGVIFQKELRDAGARAFEHAVADAKAKAEVAGYVVGRLIYVDLSRPRSDNDSGPFGSSSTPAPELPGMILPPAGVGGAASAFHAGTVEVANDDPSSLQYTVSASVTCRLYPKLPAGLLPPVPPAIESK